MATAQTLTQFKQYVIDSETSGIIDNITDAQFTVLLSQAIINRYQELKKDNPAEYFNTATLTFASDSFDLALPTDIDPDETKSFLLYDNSDRISGTIVDRARYRRQGGNIHFENKQNSGKQYFIEYAQEINQFDSSNMALTVPETVNVRSKSYLMYEIRTLFFDGLRNSEASATGQNMKVNANRIS